MRALTIWQPYASAIAFGDKRVENRTQPLAYRGLLAIHAGLAVEWGASDKAWIAAGLTPYKAGSERAAWTASLALGAVVAVAEMTGCHRDGNCYLHGHPSGICSPWAVHFQWHYQLAEVRPLAEPVPCKGARGLWTLPEEVESAVRAQLGGDP